MQTQLKPKSKGAAAIRATRQPKGLPAKPAEKPKAVDFPAAQAVLAKAVEAKPEPAPAEPTKPKQQRAPSINTRYEGSAAQK
jgi:hypothetical protein